MSLNYLEITDVETLANLLLRSQQSKAREALCIRIGIDPHKLTFIRDSSDSDFVIQLIEYLDRIDNKESLCKICCGELLPIFRKSEIYAPILRGIAIKINCQNSDCHQQNYNEFINQNTESLEVPRQNFWTIRTNLISILLGTSLVVILGAFGYRTINNANNASQIPDGTYRASCDKISVINNTLSAECESVDKKAPWRYSELENFRDCKKDHKDIKNENGILRCVYN